MAIEAKTKVKGLDINKAYVRVERIYGSKREGWTAVMGVYANANSIDQGPLETYNEVVEFDEAEVPYVSIYKKVKEDKKFSGVKDV